MLGIGISNHVYMKVLPNWNRAFLTGLGKIRVQGTLATRQKMQYTVKNYMFSGEGNGNPLQYSCLGNPMDRVPKSRTRLSDFKKKKKELHVFEFGSKKTKVVFKENKYRLILEHWLGLCVSTFCVFFSPQ